MLQRSGTIGSQMLPLFWEGDNDATFSDTNGLPSVVTAALNAGLSGISLLISDLGGYNKPARYAGDDVLFARWAEFSAFSPGMEVMSQMNLGPWDYGDEILRIFKKYSVLHMSLFPYRYRAALESSQSGMPLMRALVLMHQDDRDAREAASEYYFGPDLLVAPILSAVTQRAVYLPEGEWVDYWNGQRHSGRRTLTVDAPLDRMPLFVRAGAVLAKIPDDVMTLVPRSDFKNGDVHALDDRRVYEVYPGSEAGSITDFENRKISHSSGRLEIDGPPARITIRWRFVHPSAVTLNGHQETNVAVSGETSSVEFEHRGTSTLTWR
jgi:alpha-D-xyloside xylohydrolase